MHKTLLILAASIFTGSVAAQTFQEPPRPQPQPKSKFTFDFKTPQRGGTVTYSANNQTFVKDEYGQLEGDVKIATGDVKVSADRVTWNQKTNDITAEGNVVIDQGPQRLSATRAIYNLDSKTGTFFTARGSLEPSIYFTAEKVEKVGPSSYQLTNGVFTSCDIDNPQWSFRLASGLVTANDYARLRNLSFRAKRLPLFWSPYIVWPTKDDRSQGFLIPKPGYNNEFGGYLKTAYYLPYREWADATIRADLFSSGALGTGVSGRYKPSRSIDGKLETFIVRDPGEDAAGLPARAESWEWKYAYTHTQDDLPGGFRGVIDVRDFSDLNFFQRFEREFNLNTLSNIYSSAYLTKNRPGYSLNLRSDRRKYFLGSIVNPDGTTSQRSRLFDQLPAIEYRTYPNRLRGTPLYYALESSASRLRTIDDSGSSSTDVTADYFRTDFRPTLTMQLRTPPWLSVKPQISFRQTYYSSRLCDPEKDLSCTNSGGALQSEQIVDEPLSRFFAQGEVEVVGPSLSRIYGLDIGGFSRFKHVIEPRVRYLYTTDVDNQAQVIRFDTVDSPFLPLVRDSVEYSLTQRIIGKEKTENAAARDIMSLSVRQSVSLSRPFENRIADGREQHRFSPLIMAAHINPYQRVTLDASVTYGNVSHQLDQSSLSANIIGEKTYLNLTWFSLYKSAVASSRESSQIRFSTGAPVWRDRVRADTQINYDAERGTLLEERYLVSFFASCYDVTLEYRDFLQFQQSDQDRTQDYQISISLKNVGTFVDFRGSLDSFF